MAPAAGPAGMRIRLEDVDLPGRTCGRGPDFPEGHFNIHVAVQGPPGKRFIYLTWGVVDEAGTFTMFRRAKLWLDAVPAAVMAAAGRSGVLAGRLGLTDPDGWPLCASVRPPRIEWSAGPG